jgi:hypothetical protein
MGDIQHEAFAGAFGALFFFVLAITVLLCASAATGLPFWALGQRQVVPREARMFDSDAIWGALV